MNRSELGKLLRILMIAAATLLQGCNGTSDIEARFLQDYRAVWELADDLSAHAPRGFVFAFTNDPPHADFQAAESNLRDYMHSSKGWQGNSFRQVVLRPVTERAGETNTPHEASVILGQYFDRLERAGFTSDEVGFGNTAKLDSMEVACKSWSNRDRTLIVLGQVILNRGSGEVVASVRYWGTLNYRAR